jgi:hypothetical protein
VPKPGTKQESPIAASAEAKAILKRLSGQLKLRQIDLLDHALKALDQFVSVHGGRILLPLDFTERFSIQSERMILHEPPAPPKPSRGAGDRRTSKSVRPRAVPV